MASDSGFFITNRLSGDFCRFYIVKNQNQCVTNLVIPEGIRCCAADLWRRSRHNSVSNTMVLCTTQSDGLWNLETKICICSNTTSDVGSVLRRHYWRLDNSNAVFYWWRQQPEATGNQLSLRWQHILRCVSRVKLAVIPGSPDSLHEIQHIADVICSSWMTIQQC